jgi:5-methylcytosine-specific restriction protein A
MSRTVAEWIGKTDDTAIPPRVKVAVALAFGGRCAKCTRKLIPSHWDCDHVLALINGGQNRQTNLQPLCDDPCHPDKTKRDVATKSKSARIRKKNLGIAKPRTITRWRRFDGSIREAGKVR